MPLRFDDIALLRPLLDALLLEGVLVIAPDRRIQYASRSAKQILGRRGRADAIRVLGEAAFTTLCTPVLRDRADGVLWCDITLPGEGAPRQATACSLATSLPSGEPGVVVLVADTSGEIRLFDQNKRLIEELRQANRDLRKQIAAAVRAHEDDVGQFSEILQVAPVIFASFLEEARLALASIARARGALTDKESVAVALQDLHTLKGNARSLGLHLIGGRAHAVEDLLLACRGRSLGSEEREELAELCMQLEGALGRATLLRERLGAGDDLVRGGGGHGAMELGENLLPVDAALTRALGTLAAGSPEWEAVAEAKRSLQALTRIAVSGAFYQARVTALQAAREIGLEPPRLEVSGGALRVPVQIHRALTAALPHLVRNAVVHGIESPGERRDRGKALAGQIELSAKVADGVFSIHVRDDGRGVDVERLRSEAVASGEPDAVRLAAIELLRALGVSTADGVTRASGRGVGMAAAIDAIEGAGGTFELETPGPSGGAAFLLQFPLRADER